MLLVLTIKATQLFVSAVNVGFPFILKGAVGTMERFGTAELFCFLSQGKHKSYRERSGLVLVAAVLWLLCDRK